MRTKALRRRRAFVLMTLAAVAVDLLGARAVARQADTPLAPLEVVDVDLLSRPYVSLTVTAPRELAARELGPAAFTVRENGEARKATVRRIPTDALEVVLVIDTSGSMEGEPMAAAKAAAMDFVGTMPAGTRLGVVGFGTSPSVAVPFGSSRDALVAAIAGLTATGETALYDGLVTGGEQFAASEVPGARRFVVLLSDGGDTASVRSLDAAVQALTALDAGFFSVALATAESDLGALGRLAQATTGKVVAASDPSEIAGVYETIASNLVNQYEVRYRSEAEGTTTLDVTVDAGGVSARWQDTLELPPLPVAQRAPAHEPARPYVASAPAWWEGEWLLLAGIVPLGIALLVATWLLTARRAPRRRLAREVGPLGVPAATASALSGVAERATAFADRVLSQRGRSGRLNAALEQAGLNVRPGEFVVAVASVGIAGAAATWLLYGPLVAVAVAAAVPAAARALLSTLRARRQRRLADQLGDTLQLLAGALRSGHGLAQALDMVTREAESPTAEEFHRVIVEARLGRDLSDALDAMASRAGNEDFEWVVQAIRIHREVGGDLAEILDRVGETIRDRNRIRGQVRSLTAEGRLSAIILMALPFLVGTWMWFTNRPYVSELFDRPAGRTILGVGVLLMAVGAAVLRRLVRPEF